MTALTSTLKGQLETITGKVTKAEKAAEKQLKNIIKSTHGLRTKQLKNVQGLLKRAKGLKSAQIVKSAERIRKDLESKAALGIDHFFTKLNVPTRKDVERLSKKVGALQKRLDDIEKQSTR